MKSLLHASCVLGIALVAAKSRNDILKKDIWRSDKTIRPLNVDLCIKYRWQRYAPGTELWLMDCAGAKNKNKKKSGKYKFSWDMETGLILSVGSRIDNPNKQFCWTVQKPESEWGQRVKIDRCDPSNPEQIFELFEGRIFLKEYPHICVGFETDDNGGSPTSTTLNIIKCFSNNWGIVDIDDFTTCGDNEHFDVVGVKDCQKSCSDKTAVLCVASEPEPGCYCNDGYFRDGRTGVCEPEEKCEVEPMCRRKYETWSARMPDKCYDTCQTKVDKRTLFSDECNEVSEGRDGCGCMEGTILDEATDNCVLIEDCPAIVTGCGDNEEYLKNGTECMNCQTQFMKRLHCREKPKRGCFCVEGYMRDPKMDNKCVLQSDCTDQVDDIIKKCPKYEKWSGCGADAICKGGDLVMPAVCNSGCFCINGFVRNDLNECVDANDCEKTVCKAGDEGCCGKRPFSADFEQCCDSDASIVAHKGKCLGEETCPPNMEYAKKCMNPCGPSCKNPKQTKCPPHVRIACNPGCQCMEGYMKDGNGNCIEYSDCPEDEIHLCADVPYDHKREDCCDDGSIRPRGTCGLDVVECEENAEYRTCGPACPMTCKSLMYDIDFGCTNTCVSDCFCKKGYVRCDITHKCVSVRECTVDPCEADPKSCCNLAPFDTEKYDCCDMYLPIPFGDVCAGEIMVMQFKQSKEIGGCVDSKELLGIDKCGEEEDEEDDDDTDGEDDTDVEDLRCKDPNARWADLLPVCEKQCRELNPNTKPRNCMEKQKGFGRSGCTCKDGFYRSSNPYSCVLASDCFPEEDGEIEEEIEEIEICTGKRCCGVDGAKVKFDADLQECCQDGTVAAAGMCTNTEVTCGEYQIYKLCPTECDMMTCKNVRTSCLHGDSKRKPEEKGCSSEDAMCVCRKGYVMNTEGDCVKLPMCAGDISKGETDPDKIKELKDIFGNNFKELSDDVEEKEKDMNMGDKDMDKDSDDKDSDDNDMDKDSDKESDDKDTDVTGGTDNKDSDDTESGDKDSGDKDSGDKDVDDTSSGDKDSDNKDSDDTESGDKDSGDKDSGDKDSDDTSSTVGDNKDPVEP